MSQHIDKLQDALQVTRKKLFRRFSNSDVTCVPPTSILSGAYRAHVVAQSRLRHGSQLSLSAAGTDGDKDSRDATIDCVENGFDASSGMTSSEIRRHWLHLTAQLGAAIMSDYIKVDSQMAFKSWHQSSIATSQLKRRMTLPAGSTLTMTLPAGSTLCELGQQQRVDCSHMTDSSEKS